MARPRILEPEHADATPRAPHDFCDRDVNHAQHGSTGCPFDLLEHQMRAVRGHDDEIRPRAESLGDVEQARGSA
jgi:hypothetical protein